MFGLNLFALSSKAQVMEMKDKRKYLIILFETFRSMFGPSSVRKIYYISKKQNFVKKLQRKNKRKIGCLIKEAPNFK